MSSKALHKRLDGIQSQLGAGIGPPVTCVVVQPGESKEVAYQRHLEEHPDYAQQVEAWEKMPHHRPPRDWPKGQPFKAVRLYIHLSEERQMKNIQDGLKEAEKVSDAAVEGAKNPALKDAPSQPVNPDTRGDQGSGVFTNPSVPGSGAGEYPGKGK